MRIPFTNYEIVGHQPMSPPKEDDGQRIPHPTFLQRLTYGGGPLPFKMKAPQQKLPLPYQIPALFFETAAPVPAPAPASAPVTLPFDVGALDDDALALALKNANTSADGSIWIMTSQEKDALVHQVLDRLASGPISGTEEIVKHLLIPHLSRQLREPDADGRAPSVLRQHALPLLEKLRDEMLQCRRDGIQPPTCWDILVLPLLIESENARTPGLDVRLVTPDEPASNSATTRKPETRPTPSSSSTSRTGSIEPPRTA